MDPRARVRARRSSPGTRPRSLRVPRRPPRDPAPEAPRREPARRAIPRGHPGRPPRRTRRQPPWRPRPRPSPACPGGAVREPGWLAFSWPRCSGRGTLRSRRTGSRIRHGGRTTPARPG
jgi:hypothetical protein